MILQNRLELLKLLTSHWKTIFGNFNNSIGYIGWVGHRNLGDEAMLQSFTKLFSYYTIFPYSMINNFPRIEERIRPKRLRAIALGGGTLINSSGSFKNFISTWQNYPDSPKFTFCSGVKNPMFWNTVSGWNNDISEWTQYLDKCEYVSVRGPLSKKILDDAGFKRAKIIGDLALSLADNEISDKSKKKILGINIGSSGGKMWGSEDILLDTMSNLIKILIRKNWDITLFPVWDKDVTIIETLSRRIGYPLRIFYGYKSIKRTLSFLRSCNAVIAMKLHAVVMAHCAYTPAIMLEYRPKCLDYMMSVGMEKYNIRTDKIESNEIEDLLCELYANSLQYQHQLKKLIDQYKDLQTKAKQEIYKFLS